MDSKRIGLSRRWIAKIKYRGQYSHQNKGFFREYQRNLVKHCLQAEQNFLSVAILNPAPVKMIIFKLSPLKSHVSTL